MNYTINAYQLVLDSFEHGTKYINRYFNCRRVDVDNLTIPVFRLKETNAQNISDINYVYVEQLKTYYFVKHIELLNNGIIELYCVLDMFRKGE